MGDLSKWRQAHLQQAKTNLRGMDQKHPDRLTAQEGLGERDMR